MREKVKCVVAVGLLAALAPLLVGCPAVDVVIFKDEALERAVRAELGQPFGFLTRADMLRLQTLEASAMGIRDLTGLETLEAIFRCVERHPAIFITSHESKELLMKAMEAGAYTLLRKPLSAGLVVVTLKHLLDKFYGA